MSNPAVIPLREFGTLKSAYETTDLGLGSLVRCKNGILRPFGAVKGPPTYERLWAIGEATTVQDTYRNLTFNGNAIGLSGSQRTANKCVAIRIYRQGKNFLLFYDLINSKCRGMFYLGDDGTYTSGTYDFEAGPPSYEVLAVGLNATAFWYGKRMASMLKLSNNVDIPVCVQLGRTAVPGKWRLAGSNVAPSPAIVSKVAPGTTTNVQAFTTIPGSPNLRIFFDASNGIIVGVYSASAAISSVSTATDRITISGFTPVENEIVALIGGTAPGGIALYTGYQVRNVSGTSFQLYLGGNLINITSSSTSSTVVRVYDADLVANTQITIASTGTLPTGITAGTYYIRIPSTWQTSISATPGGPNVTFTGAGSPVTAHTMVISGRATRAGGKDLTFTADPIAFPGQEGNNKIRVQITYSSYTTEIQSSRTGSGTATDPYIYALVTGNSAASSSNDAIVSHVNGDSLAVGILSASSLPDNTADTGSWIAQTLTNGSGSGVSDGLTSQTVTVYLRYWDEGNERLGYEGISSDISNEIILTSSETSDILVSIPTDPSAEGGRFGFIRVYFQFGEGANAIWNLVGTVPNTSGTKTLQVGTNTVIGQAMSADQNRPLPFKDVVMVRNQVWHGGSLTTPEYLYVSKQATDDEIAPEGASILDPFLIVLPEQVTDFYVTALDTDDFRLHVHTNQGVVLMNPLNPTEDRHIPQVPVGALNPDCLVKWEKSQIYYLGSDMTIYQFDGNRYGRRNASAATKDATQYILDVANLDVISRNPDRVTAWLDVRGEMLYYHFPAQDNTLNGFVYDFRANGVVGELTHPKVASMTEMEPERPERVWSDEEGNLFVINSLTQNDWGDALPASPTFTPHSTAVPMPEQYNGWGFFDYQGKRYYQAGETILETGFVDLADPTKARTWCGFIWETVKNSRGFIEVTFTNLDGRSVTRIYGDMAVKGSNRPHKVGLLLGGNAVKIKIRVIWAEQAPWIIRTAALLYRSAGMW